MAVQLVACLASENCWSYSYLTQVQGADQTPAETNELIHWFHLKFCWNLSINAVQSEKLNLSELPQNQVFSACSYRTGSLTAEKKQCRIIEFVK